MWSDAQAETKETRGRGEAGLEKERRCTYAKGEPASSLRSQPGRKDGEGWVEDSTGVVGCLVVGGMRRGKWVKGKEEYVTRTQTTWKSPGIK